MKKKEFKIEMGRTYDERVALRPTSRSLIGIQLHITNTDLQTTLRQAQFV